MSIAHTSIFQWSVKRPNPQVERFLARPAFPAEAEAAATEILADIRKRGERGVLSAAKKFDGAPLSPAELRVGGAEINAASKGVPPQIKRAVQEAHRRVMAFARGGGTRGSSSRRWTGWGSMSRGGPPPSPPPPS